MLMNDMSGEHFERLAQIRAEHLRLDNELLALQTEGKPALTHYRVERAAGGRALLRLRLETGRTHQIRVHLASIGCPVCGDYLYGTEFAELPGRFALHSARLCCSQPVTGERIEVEEPLPEELERLLR